MLATEQNRLQADRLMEHLKVLCNQIGPRPATSRAERRAAEYVRQVLETLGVDDVRDQFFTSPDSAGWALAPWWLLGAVAALLGGRTGRLAGGVGLLLAAKGLRDTLLQRPSPVAGLMAQGASQNVIARLAPSGEVKQRVFLVAHLDSGKQRFALPVPVPGLTRPLYTAALALLGTAGVGMLAGGLVGQKRRGGLQQLAAGVSLLGAALTIADEAQPYVEGANDNASSVATLLDLAARLKAEPLAHTEVVLLFTGCAEAGAVGMTDFLDKDAPPRHNSTFINLEMVGAGRLGYAMQSGASAFSSTRPSPQITVLAASIARDNPALRANGVNLPLVDELAPIVARGYEAITIVGYDDHGEPAHWHRASDMLAGIEADTLVRASQYVTHILQALDSKAG